MDLNCLYTSPPDCSKWCSSISLLDYALNRESYNIASAILRAGANPSSYLIKDCPNCNYDDVVKKLYSQLKYKDYKLDINGSYSDSHNDYFGDYDF